MTCTPYIAAVEEWIFGGQPVLWMEQFITPGRTDFFNAFYANFYLVAPSVFLVLWFSGRRNEARTALLGVILCFYSGYVLYVLLPAAPPRLYFTSLGLFTKSLQGGPITHFQEALLAMMPNHAARGAFPSLHAAVSCLSLYYAAQLLPPLLSVPADLRGGAAGVHGVSAPPLGGGSAGRGRARAVGALADAAVRAILGGALHG